MSLAREHCEACTAATPRLGDAELEALRAELHADWEVDAAATRLRRRVRTPDFASAFGLATQIGMLAEREGHHPDLGVGWGHLEVELTTHAVGGLTRNDAVLAAHIDRLLR